MTFPTPRQLSDLDDLTLYMRTVAGEYRRHLPAARAHITVRLMRFLGVDPTGYIGAELDAKEWLERLESEQNIETGR